MRRIKEIELYKEDLVYLIQTTEYKNEQKLLTTLLVYILNAGKLKDEKSLLKTIKASLPKEVGDKTMGNLTEQWFKQGEQKGVERGMQLGMEQGVERGVERGMELGMERGEYKKARLIALNLLKKGLDVETIAETTDLPINIIQHLKKRILH